MQKILINKKKIKSFKIHSATKVFQALRIFVNKEISELIYGLINATKTLLLYFLRYLVQIYLLKNLLYL